MPRANRLVNEQSPYLLQHAANPVDWYPWGEEAFAAAREADKPLFVSIGYATCHWCHVMARESFEDEETAAMINEWFVPVKVDREERPDVDGAFMAACLASTGSGGWPLTVFADAEGTPFFAGTYFPKETRGNHIGMRELLPRVAAFWRENRKEALATSARFKEALSRVQTAPDETPDVALIERGARETLDESDPEHGGFGDAPKFPQPHRIDLLLRRRRRADDRDALDAATRALDGMILGGIHDRLGGGFHRYSTDAEWRLPHFEKMLYDQATISLALVDAWRATGETRYRRAAERTLDYVLRDLRDPTGAFHSAEDADSEGVEGKFYVWSADEIDEALGEDAPLAREAYDVKPEGNFFDPHGAAPPKANVLFQTESDEALAKKRGVSVEELRAKLDAIDARLFDRRETRVRPLRDEKILLDWNGLMIAALARAGRAFSETRYVNAASEAAEFLLAELRDDRGEYLRRYKDGVAKFDATLDDYAFFAFGLLELYEATFDPAWLARSAETLDKAEERLWDEEHGGFFFSIERKDVFFRRKEHHDGATPSGASITAYASARLGRLTGDARRAELAEKTLRAAGEEIERAPSQFAAALAALAELREPASELAIVGEDAEEALDRLRVGYYPENATLWKNAENAEELAAIAPFTKEMSLVEGETRYYYCENNACAAPTTDLDEALAKTRRGPRSS